MKIIVLQMFLMITAVFLPSQVGRSQDSSGGDGTYSNPYYARTNAVGANFGSYNYMGQDVMDVYGEFHIMQKDYSSVTYINAAGFEGTMSVRGGTLDFDYEWDWDQNCDYDGEIRVLKRVYKNFFLPAIGMVDRDITRTLLWNSNYSSYGSGTQSAEATIKVQGVGEIDTIDYQFDVQTYQWPLFQAPWSLDAERATPTPALPVFPLGALASSFNLSDSASVASIQFPGVLYGTYLDWLWDPTKRSLFLSTPSQSLYNSNIEKPSPWSQSEMSWMLPAA